MRTIVTWVNGVRHFVFEEEKEGEIKIGIDTNVLVHLFENAEKMNLFKDEGYILCVTQKCVEELRKQIEKLNLKDANTKQVADRFLNNNNMYIVYGEASREDVRAFEKKCQKAGINCHWPDSEIILSFKKEGIERVYSQDNNFRKAAEFLGLKVEKFDFFKNEKFRT